MSRDGTAVTQTNSTNVRSLYRYELKEETMRFQYETITIILPIYRYNNNKLKLCDNL